MYMYVQQFAKLKIFEHRLPTHLKSHKSTSCKNLRLAFAPYSFHRLRFTRLCALQEQPSLVSWKHRHHSIAGLNCYHDPRIQLATCHPSPKKENQSSTHHTCTLFHALFHTGGLIFCDFMCTFKEKKNKKYYLPLPFDPLQRKQDYTHPFPTVLLFPLIF